MTYINAYLQTEVFQLLFNKNQAQFSSLYKITAIQPRLCTFFRPSLPKNQ